MSIIYNVSVSCQKVLHFSCSCLQGMLKSAIMKTDILDYSLPSKCIAQYPVEKRDASRLLVVDRQAGTFKEDEFAHIGQYLNPGDSLVLNDTRVIRARLQGHKPTGGKVEIFLLHEISPGEWEALVRPSARIKSGTIISIGNDSLHAVVNDPLPGGRRSVHFEESNVIARLEEAGEIPLPPYIHREDREPIDAERYQTVYAEHPGAVAAPTAGLHFTPELLDSLEHKGIHRTSLTLHVGYGTFKPVQVDRLEDHTVDPEDFDFPESTADLLNETRTAGHRVVAVGTTSTRVLETQFVDGAFRPGHGITKCYIFPPYPFRAVDTLITNFHLPKSSLLALVCAFGGTELILEAYRHAAKNDFRFYSYGDAMLVL